MGVVARIQIFFLFYFKIMIDIIEEWRPVVGYEGLYEVSNTGRVRSLDRYVRSKSKSYRLQKGSILSPSTSNGYLYVILQASQVTRKFRIHRLVAQAFLPNPDNLPQVNHKDEDKLNNRVDNLEWCTVKYNNNYGTRTIRAKETAIKNGSWSGLSREEYKKKYYQENKDSYREYYKKWRENNKDYQRKHKKTV